ncbi:hypothetical protein CKF54_05985 [Psittacicella hinzii]|uniref:Uncharacterized protein n=1 Tax=Psittacicella hinzii TaxID=2028575 RepID=A0A3A1Y707_9GAMM|nr:hypothetical protein [Psittacicella hinzii]RIY31844.1 hypothetical protein CKF54_05985 [Psittacicella hinzii]
MCDNKNHNHTLEELEAGVKEQLEEVAELLNEGAEEEQLPYHDIVPTEKTFSSNQEIEYIPLLIKSLEDIRNAPDSTLSCEFLELQEVVRQFRKSFKATLLDHPKICECHVEGAIFSWACYNELDGFPIFIDTLKVLSEEEENGDLEPWLTQEFLDQCQSLRRAMVEFIELRGENFKAYNLLQSFLDLESEEKGEPMSILHLMSEFFYSFMSYTYATLELDYDSLTPAQQETFGDFVQFIQMFTQETDITSYLYIRQMFNDPHQVEFFNLEFDLESVFPNNLQAHVLMAQIAVEAYIKGIEYNSNILDFTNYFFPARVIREKVYQS